MRRFNTVTLVWKAVTLGGVFYLVMPLGFMLFMLFGWLVSSEDTPEYAVGFLYLLTTVYWPFWVGGLLREGWGRVVLLLPMDRRCGARALLLLGTILPVLWALMWAAPVFVLFSLARAVNWALLLQWASLQYCALSSLLLLHSMASVGYFPGLLTARSRPLRGWRWGLTLAAHCLILLAILSMARRVIEEDLSLANALFASGALFSVLGVARLRSLAVTPGVGRHLRRLTDYLPRERPPRPRSLLRRRWPRASRLFWLGLIARNTLIAMCLVLCWMLFESVLVPEGGEHEVGWGTLGVWGILLPLFCLWAIAPVVRALRAIRLLPCSSSGLATRLVSTSLGSIVICVGLLTLAVLLLEDPETAEKCAPGIVAIAGTSSLVIPRYLYGGMGPALGVLMANLLLAFYLIAIAEIWSLETFPDWLLAFGGVAVVLAMIFTWRAAAKAQDSLSPLPGS